MDRYGELCLNWSVGYRGSPLHFVVDDILVYDCANSLSFVKTDGIHVQSLESEGSGVAALTVCQKAGYIAYAECTLKPKIFVIMYPLFESRCIIKDGAQLEYRQLAFSGDGKKLVSLSGVPDFKMTLWDISERTGVEICTVSVGMDTTEVSINPLNWKQIVLFGPTRITLWTLEHCGKEDLFTPIEVKLPEKTTEVGSKTMPKVLPPMSTSTPTDTDTDMQSAGMGANMGLFVPPNMSEVFYKESYEEFVKQKEPMEVKSHCWTPNQSIYVGCAGGQLMMVDFDTGSATVLVNPQPPMLGSETESDESLGSVLSEVPKTAHSLLKEGCADCLALSRRGLFTAGKSGSIHCFDVKTLSLLEEVAVLQPVRQLCCSPSCSRLAVGTERGAILTVDPLQLTPSLQLLFNHQDAELIGLEVLCPGSEHCVTCRSNGIVQVWDVLNGDLISTFNMNTECTSIACPVSCKVGVVGTTSGHLCFLSLTNPTSPVLVDRRLMHTGPVTAVKHDQAGCFMASISASDPVLLYNSKPSTNFEVLGYLDVSGSVMDVSFISMGDSIRMGILSYDSENNQQEIKHVQLKKSLLEQKPPELYQDVSKKLSPEFLGCKLAILDKSVNTLTLTLIPDNKTLTILDTTMQLAQFDLLDTDQEVSATELHTYEGHDMKSAKIALSFHQKWSASVASDGKLLLRLAGNPENFLSCNPHHYKTKGCCDVILTRDSQSLITIGDSRSITCWKLKCSDYGNTKSGAAVDYFTKFVESMEDQHTTENQILSDMPALDTDGMPPPEDDKNWFTLAREKATRAEDEKYSETKSQLHAEICTLRDRVLEMISTNEKLPDIEKLGRQEFILDTEDYQRMLQEEEKLIGGVREEIEFSNLAAMFLKELIKRECWDDMAVKGRTIKGFQVQTEVHNYPLLPRSEETMRELEKIRVLRNIEIVERKFRREATTELKQTLQPTRHEKLVDDEDFMGESKDKQAQPKEEGEAVPGDPHALLGSHRAQYGGQDDLLASQFELHSQVSKKHHIVLLENCIHTVKEQFNKEFDETLRSKVNEIARIKEKNVRISKIISQLKLDDPLVQPSLGVLEQPEQLLTVQDSEVKVEKYVSPEEQKQREEAAKLEEERRLAAMGDNPRERALDMMMGGRLEANVEEDLFKDLPRPEFMSKDPAEMSEEEIRMAREFEKKEEAFLEEREKLKKALEAELRKLQASIVQGMEQFDERLQRLLQRKIHSQMVIHQDQLKILHLIRSLFVEKEVAMKIQQFNDLLREKKATKIQLGTSISEARLRVEEVKEQYEVLVAEDKEMDKAFKKDFADCEPYVDQLYRLFRKRPRGQKLKPGMEALVHVGDPTSQNLFAVRPMSAAHGGRDGENVMGELDHVSHMPEGLESHSWERFVTHRHRKVESEMKVKTLALELAEDNSFLQRRLNEESKVQQEIQNAFKDISRLQEDKVVFDLNLEIQFLLKQGQVEVDMDDFIPDFSNSVLVHRSRIEDLNGQIKTLGEAKLNNMMECKDFKRGIRLLEWERRKMELDQEELLDKARDIQMMRVTRDLLQRLHERDLFAKDIREKETLESTIEFNKRALKKQLFEKAKILKDVSKQVKAKITENKELDKKLRELQVSVAERAQIEKLADVAPSVANREQRMQEIVTRRKLVDTIKLQDEEYSVLKMEVEKLRMKTFPALVQVD